MNRSDSLSRLFCMQSFYSASLFDYFSEPESVPSNDGRITFLFPRPELLPV